MSHARTVSNLYESLRDELSLGWVAGREAGEVELIEDQDELAAAEAVGYLDLVHRRRVQVLGQDELNFLQGLGKNSYQDTLQRLFSPPVGLVILADGATAPNDMPAQADHAGVALMTSPQPRAEVVRRARAQLAAGPTRRAILHGVFMEVMGIGVLVTGEAGVGKSELALELVTRGHRLIADDAPEFTRISDDTINGSCPGLLRGFLEVRGLGVIDLRAMFGDGAIKHSKFLRLIVNLVSLSEEELNALDRFPCYRDHRRMLGIDIPQTKVPVVPGRNLAVLVEAAVRDHILRMNGYDASQEFLSRQQRLIDQDEP